MRNNFSSCYLFVYIPYESNKQETLLSTTVLLRVSYVKFRGERFRSRRVIVFLSIPRNLRRYALIIRTSLFFFCPWKRPRHIRAQDRPSGMSLLLSTSSSAHSSPLSGLLSPSFAPAFFFLQFLRSIRSTTFHHQVPHATLTSLARLPRRPSIAHPLLRVCVTQTYLN